MNLLIYPLYLINNNTEHYSAHKEIIEQNISYIDKFHSVDEIKVIGKSVSSWSEMINDLMKNIEDLLKAKNNILLCEADNFIVEDFKEVFSLNKFTLFALCNNGSKLDKNLPGGEYLNAGFAYFPYKNFEKYFKFKKIDERDSSKSSLIYEKQINDIFYSQFNSHIDGLNYINKKIGFSNYNWRGLLCIDVDNRFLYKRMPSVKKIKSIHFLNLSQYIHKVNGFNPFWYKKFVNDLASGKSKKIVILKILYHYWKYVDIKIVKKKYRLVKYFITILLSK